MGFANFSDDETGASPNSAIVKMSRGSANEASAREWLKRRGDHVLLCRFDTPFAEVDILALRPSGCLLLCEVKSSFWPDGAALGLGPRQRLRLSRAAAWISSETNRDVEIVLLGPSTQSGHFDEVPIF